MKPLAWKRANESSWVCEHGCILVRCAQMQNNHSDTKLWLPSITIRIDRHLIRYEECDWQVGLSLSQKKVAERLNEILIEYKEVLLSVQGLTGN